MMTYDRKLGRRSGLSAIAGLAFASTSYAALAQALPIDTIIADGIEVDVPDGTIVENYRAAASGFYAMNSGIINALGGVNITMLGEGGVGVQIQNLGSIRLSDAAITTHGVRGTGIYNRDGDVFGTGVSVLTYGDDAVGVRVANSQHYGTVPTLKLENSHIATKGERAHGVVVGHVGVGELVRTSVITGGADSDGVRAEMDASATLRGSSVLTAQGHGVFVDRSRILIEGSDIHARGTGKAALRLGGRPNDVILAKENIATIDGSRLVSADGPAILIEGEVLSTVTISGGSVVESGTGTLLDVRDAAIADLTVDNSTLIGDVAVQEGASAEITLQNNGSLTGQLTGVDNLALNSGGTWKMVADGGVTSLAMNGGAVEISDGTGSQFNTLTVGTLAGNGTFVMGTNLGIPEGDKLVVTEAGGASGDHMLHVRNTGAEPTEENALTLVETNGGGATFKVVGDAVDLGVYKYYLHQVGDDWRLSGSQLDGGGSGPGPEDLTPSAQTVIGLHAGAANVFYGELGTLRQRMGDVRMGKGENGIWGRTYGRGLKGNGAAGDFNQSLWGLQAGAEREINVGGLPIIFGVFGGYSNSTVNLDGPSEGEIDSGYGGLYATWLGNDGLYVDGLFKANRFSNDARVVMSDGTGASGGYDVTGVGGQIAAGKTYDLGSGWYAEPFAQLAALHIGSFDYRLSNGMVTDGGAYNSLQGRIGATLGFNHMLDDGSVLQPYMRVAVAQEFIDNNTLRINNVGFNNSFDGTRGEVGAGFAYQISDAFQIHADVDFSGGKDVSRNFGGNFGLSYKF